MEELMGHFLGDPVLENQSQPRINATASSTRQTASVVVNASSVAQPMEMNEERFIMEEDDSSSDSDSNGSGSDENDGEEIEDENDDEEAVSELDVDEETRQFIEMYDHVYGRHLSPELERDSEDILMIQYADNGSNNVTNSSSSNGNHFESYCTIIPV